MPYIEVDQTIRVNGFDYHRTVIWHYYTDSCYGADADGNRGVSQTFYEVHDVRPWKEEGGFQVTDPELLSVLDNDGEDAIDDTMPTQ